MAALDPQIAGAAPYDRKSSVTIRSGTKAYFFSSFRINFKGGFFGGGNIRPKEEIANFALMMKSNQPISVKTCRFLTEWSITDFVVLDKTIPQNMGGYNYQLFEFNAIQDIPVILAQSNR